MRQRRAGRLGSARVLERLAHEDEREHVQQAVLDVGLQLRDLRRQVLQRRRQRRATSQKTPGYKTWSKNDGLQGTVRKRRATSHEAGQHT